MAFAPRPLAALLVPLGLALLAQPVAADKLSELIYQKTLKSTAYIIARVDTAKTTLGSGWIVDRQRRWLVTNHHVVVENGKVLKDLSVIFPLYQNGKVIGDKEATLKKAARVRGEVLLTDPKRDLAVVVLKSLPGDVQAMKLATLTPNPGERVHSLGNPAASGGLWIYSQGIVRQVFRDRYTFKDGQRIDCKILQTQSPSNAGDSGGPVVNDRGELVGVTSSATPKGVLLTNCIELGEVTFFLAQARKKATPPAIATPTSKRRR